MISASESLQQVAVRWRLQNVCLFSGSHPNRLGGCLSFQRFIQREAYWEAASYSMRLLPTSSLVLQLSMTLAANSSLLKIGKLRMSPDKYPLRSPSYLSRSRSSYTQWL